MTELYSSFAFRRTPSTLAFTLGREFKGNPLLAYTTSYTDIYKLLRVTQPRRSREYKDETVLACGRFRLTSTLINFGRLANDLFSLSLSLLLSFSLFLLLILKRNSGMVYESAVCRYRISLISQRLLKEEEVEREWKERLWHTRDSRIFQQSAKHCEVSRIGWEFNMLST